MATPTDAERLLHRSQHLDQTIINVSGSSLPAITNQLASHCLHHRLIEDFVLFKVRLLRAAIGSAVELIVKVHFPTRTFSVCRITPHRHIGKYSTLRGMKCALTASMGMYAAIPPRFYDITHPDRYCWNNSHYWSI